MTTKAEKAAQAEQERQDKEAADRADFLERFYQMELIARDKGHSILEIIVALVQDKVGENIRYVPPVVETAEDTE